MTVSVLSVVSRNDGRDIAVTFEMSDGEHAQRETFIVSTDFLASNRIFIGESDTDTYDLVSFNAQIYDALKKGINILGYGLYSEKALRTKLISKGVSRDIALEAVAKLKHMGYFDAHGNACREAERCVEKLWGKKRIVAALYSKGYAQDAIRDALDFLEDEGIDYVELCRDRISKSSKATKEMISDPIGRQKLIASLARYGFSNSEIREAFGMMTDEE